MSDVLAELTKPLLLGLPTAAATLAMAGAVVALASSLGFVVLVVALLLLFEPQVLFARKIMEAAPFRAVAYGFLAFLAMVPVAVFLTVTIIGIPLAVAGAAVAMAALCLGAVAACEWLGHALAARAGKPLAPVWRGLLGLAVLFLVGFVPFVGAALHAVAVLAGLGAVAQSRFRAGDN